MSWDLVFTELPEWNLALSEQNSNADRAGVGSRTAALAEVGVPGAPGPPGPQGPPGADGSSDGTPRVLGVERSFAVAADTWVLDHDLGWVPAVVTYDADGQQIEGKVVENTIARTTVSWYMPKTGRMSVS